jgi:hypothetical protein
MIQEEIQEKGGSELEPPFSDLGFCGGDRIRTGVQTSSPKAFYMFISLLIVGNEQGMNKPIHFVAAFVLRKYRSHPKMDLLSATCFVFESAAGRGNRSTGPAALMTT